MRNIITLVILTAMVAASTAAPVTDEITQSVDRFYDKLNKENLVLRKFNYYIHGHFRADENQTIFTLESDPVEKGSAANFGKVLIIDNKLTVGPDPQSEYVGQYQGIDPYADFNTAATNMNMNMIFRNEEYNGSTLSISGRQPVNEEVRVLSVTGGTGAFRLARGTVLASTIRVDPVTTNGLYLYRMYVVTPVVGGSRPVAA